MTNQFGNIQLERIKELFANVNEITQREARQKLVSFWLEKAKLHGCSSRTRYCFPDRIMPKLGFSKHRTNYDKYVVWRRET